MLVDAEAALAAATPYLASDVASERGAAALMIGELVSLELPTAATAASDVLFQLLLIETEPFVRDDVATGLGKIWNACDIDRTSLTLAGHPNVNARYAAAKNLALRTTDHPDDAEGRAALTALAYDPDADVRSWAETGLETLSTT